MTFGDGKDGVLGIRLRPLLQEDKGKAIITNAEGLEKEKALWGKPSPWCDYSGEINGEKVGIAILDNPANPRHPVRWHARAYGLFAANPFGLHDFESSRDKTKGNLTIPAKQSITFRYRFYLHEGDEKQAKVAERYQEYVGAADRSK